MTDKQLAELDAKYRWVYPRGERATRRCVNRNRFTSAHLLSDDGMLCLACGARRVEKAKKAKRTTIREAFQALRAAGGDAWDDVDDPQAFLDEMTGDR